jgi:hypothetical protein
LPQMLNGFLLLLLHPLCHIDYHHLMLDALYILVQTMIHGGICHS